MTEPDWVSSDEERVLREMDISQDAYGTPYKINDLDKVTESEPRGRATLNNADGHKLAKCPRQKDRAVISCENLPGRLENYQLKFACEWEE